MSRPALVIFIAMMFFLAVERCHAGRIVIDTDTTLDYVIGPFEPPIDIVDGVAGPTFVEIVDGANIAPNIHARGQSHLEVRGGITGGFMWAHDDATIDIHDGWIATGEDVIAEGNSQINIYGGRFGDSIYVADRGVVNLYGGTFDRAGGGAVLLFAHDGVINVFGSDFSLGPVQQGGIRDLRGVLSDGAFLDIQIYPRLETLGSGRVVLHTIPEPSTAMLALSVIIPFVGFQCSRGRGILGAAILCY